MPNHYPRSGRGMSISVLVCLLIPTLLLCAGLAVDGAAKAAADRRAEAVAAQAARAGLDAATPVLLGGGDASALAIAAAQQILAAHPSIDGQVQIADQTLQVTTATSVRTIFLSLAGVHELPGRGAATVELRADSP